MQIFSRAISCALAVSLAVTMGGCAILKKLHLPGRHRKKPPRAEAVAKPQLVGTITLVNQDTRFVLIDLGSAAVPRAGTALKAMSGGVETGVVTVGEIRKRPFAVADIVSGTPKRGDQVFQ
jgi:hypothetical protein